MPFYQQSKCQLILSLYLNMLRTCGTSDAPRPPSLRGIMKHLFRIVSPKRYGYFPQWGVSPRCPADRIVRSPKRGRTDDFFGKKMTSGEPASGRRPAGPPKRDTGCGISPHCGDLPHMPLSGPARGIIGPCSRDESDHGGLKGRETVGLQQAARRKVWRIATPGCRRRNGVDT